ncbi:SCO2524 family protein [Actinoplanes sp. KI2]|uniref:SCO2524 family protein n=1 Tax=Actinoplanes sp. KI2 TaxID=2983315 RepID=UPI0021D57481|nr:SCO2524 family protein [Actinoplanes sp. KI2]MCU7728697.1 SCO2524 family protein [Actinoplanes sp. KI2]
MQIQPRQRLLDIWQATARVSFRDKQWVPDGLNSISDAEQLLCIMAPATGIPLFRLDQPDEVAADVQDKLRALGDNREIPVQLIKALTGYLTQYTAPDGTPIFSGGGYFRSDVEGEDVKQAQRDLDVVDSFSISVTLMLAIIGFTKIFRQVISRPALIEDVESLERMANRRLSAAMIGLLRSFAVNVFSADSDFGDELIRTVNQERRPIPQVVDELRRALREINARLRDDVTIGSGSAEGTELDNPNRLFECGWSWGVVREAPEIQTAPETGDFQQKPGVAQNAPYLYFTTVALDAIQALSSERTRLLGLLDPEQARLAQSLQLRFELTRSYWATIATFGAGRWPLEDLPWRTTDGIESDYFSLLVSGMVMQNMLSTRTSDTDRRRVAEVLDKLASRSRITLRSTKPETAIAVHYPGVRFPLEGSEDVGGPTLAWTVADYAPTLLRRTLDLARTLTDNEGRSRLIELSNSIWDHLHSRMIVDGDDRDLWDRPAGAYSYLAREDDGPGEASWYYTKRVVDCLVAAAELIQETAPASDLLGQIAEDLLNEAEYLYDRELLNGTTTRGEALKVELERIGTELRRARTVRPGRPGVAVALTEDVLRRLDRLSAARRAEAG